MITIGLESAIGMGAYDAIGRVELDDEFGRSRSSAKKEQPQRERWTRVEAGQDGLMLHRYLGPAKGRQMKNMIAQFPVSVH